MMNATPRFPCSEYHCSILPSRYRSTVSRTSSGRTARTCDCSKPGLMVPMARILVVGVVFMAAPCAFAELKPTRQPISASAAASANFMLSLFCVSLRRPVNPKPARDALALDAAHGQAGAHAMAERIIGRDRRQRIGANGDQGRGH